MAVILLALFPVLLLFNPRLGFVALGLAVVLLCRGKVSDARETARRRTSDDL